MSFYRRLRHVESRLGLLTERSQVTGHVTTDDCKPLMFIHPTIQLLCIVHQQTLACLDTTLNRLRRLLRRKRTCMRSRRRGLHWCIRPPTIGRSARLVTGERASAAHSGASGLHAHGRNDPESKIFFIHSLAIRFHLESNYASISYTSYVIYLSSDPPCPQRQRLYTHNGRFDVAPERHYANHNTQNVYNIVPITRDVADTTAFLASMFLCL
jgi:hypothetical protein